MRATEKSGKQIKDTSVIFRATKETKAQAEAVRALLKLQSTSEVFRSLLSAKAAELGVK